MCNFRVGQKVVCVDEKPLPSPPGVRYVYNVLPVKGQVYTVRALGWAADGHYGLFLNEVIRPPSTVTGVEMPWGAWRFRPVVERKTDIGVFKAMLNTNPETVGAA